MNASHLLFGGKPAEKEARVGGKALSLQRDSSIHDAEAALLVGVHLDEDDAPAASSLHERLLYGESIQGVRDRASESDTSTEGSRAESPGLLERCRVACCCTSRGRLSMWPSLDHQHESLFGTAHGGRLDPDRLRVRKLLERSPSVFPPLVEWPAGSTWAIATIFVACVAAVCLLPSHWLDRLSLGDSDDETTAAMRWRVVAYASIPVVACVITYFHVWLALWMMFYPVRFRGCLRLPGTNIGFPGWQGIVPFKSVRMARMATELMTQRLISVSEEFRKARPEVMASIMHPLLADDFDRTLRQVLRTRKPNLWNRLPAAIQEAVVRRGTDKIDQVTRAITIELQRDIEQLVNIKVLVERHFISDTSALNTMFIQCGYRELVFIRDNGAWLGFVFGLVQLGVWVAWHPAHEQPFHLTLQGLVVFPLFGLVLGLVTNWMSLIVIFSPVERTRVCGWTLHGLFLRRQNEVAAVYAHLAACEVIPASTLARALATGETCDKGPSRLHSIFRRHLEQGVNSALEDQHLLVKAGTAAVLDPQDVDVIREDVVRRLVEVAPGKLVAPTVVDYLHGSIGLERTIRERMEQLPSADFERLLHPVFEEDEWKLIVVGGALGVVIGLLQALFIN